MLNNKEEKVKDIVYGFFEYIENQVLTNEFHTEVISAIKSKLNEGYELVENNELEKAFENLSSELANNFIVLNREGIEKAKQIINLCKLDKAWEYDLRRIDSLGYIEGSWKLVDAEPLAIENKYTFYKPSRKITNNLKIGNIVKMIFEFDSTNEDHPMGERMWVKITRIDNDKFKGKLDNNPLYLHELYAGDEITFEHKHIIDHDLEIDEPNLVDKYLDRCFVTTKVLYENQEVKYLYREKPDKLDNERGYKDSGWRIMSGDESQEYMDNVENIHLVSLGAVLSRDDSFQNILESPIGTSYEKNESGEFIKVEENRD